MTKEEVYEKVMGHKPDKRFGIKGSFSWNDISELMDEAVKNCSIPNVSNRRELLIAFFMHFRDKGEQKIGMTIEEFVDDYLSNL